MRNTVTAREQNAMSVAIIIPLAGVLSFTNTPDFALPQTNCSLTSSIQHKADIPLSLLLLITGFVLIFIDIAITAALCVIKYSRRCGVFIMAWYLVTVVCTATWTFLSILYLAVVMPSWAENRELCDYLVVVWTFMCVGYCGVLTIVYLISIVVVIAYDCNSWRNSRSLGI